MNNDIYVYNTSQYTIAVNLSNGDYEYINNKTNTPEMIDKKINDIKTKFSHEYEIKNSNHFSYDEIKVLYLSVHASTQCNLKCKYCFRDSKSSFENMSYEKVKLFLDNSINKYSSLEKIIVDPTGSGEPLLNIDLITKIGDYCKIKSNELNREVLPMLVTNGVFLDDGVVQALRDSGILFGISIDGDKKQHDANRIDYSNKGSYEQIIKKVRKIKDRSLLGAAVTLNSANMDLIKIYKSLIKYFPTISVKPVRNNSWHGINDSNIEELLIQYTKFADFLVKRTLSYDLSYISAILNGDDYFGKFLLRIIAKQPVSTRCDAGFGRVSLAFDGKIYGCPAAIGIKDLVIGSIQDGIDYGKQNKLYHVLTERKHCADCPAKFTCGGECLVNAYYNKQDITEIDRTMCQLKLHLYWNAHIINSYLLEANPKLHRMIYKACIEKINRFGIDPELDRVVQANPDMKFTEIKRLKDNKHPKYSEMKQSINDMLVK